MRNTVEMAEGGGGVTDIPTMLYVLNMSKLDPGGIWTQDLSALPAELMSFSCKADSSKLMNKNYNNIPNIHNDCLYSNNLWA